MITQLIEQIKTYKEFKKIRANKKAGLELDKLGNIILIVILLIICIVVIFSIIKPNLDSQGSEIINIIP